MKELIMKTLLLAFMRFMSSEPTLCVAATHAVCFILH